LKMHARRQAMETTYAFLKQNALATFLVLAVLSANGQIWFLNGSVERVLYADFEPPPYPQ
ncbi:MAG: hypothetical protein OXI17_09680, partial [Gammaproteobacteria bacterium]|nr:hypothetical protein [Gammaproteobacteria bacterium]